MIEGKICKSMTMVMSEIGAIGKNQTNTMQKYKFRGIDDLQNALHPVLVKHGVFIVPRVVDEFHELKEVVRSNGNKGIDKHVHIQVEYDFVCDDGSKVTIGPIASEGLDSSDKATNKALSAALKYCLIQTFCVPTQDMDDSDRETIEIQPAQNGPCRAVPTYAATYEVGGRSSAGEYDVSLDKRPVTLPQLKRLEAIIKENGWTHEQAKNTCKILYKIDSSKNLNRAQYEDLCNIIATTIYGEGAQ
jgi:hypothetical protein